MWKILSLYLWKEEKKEGNKLLSWNAYDPAWPDFVVLNMVVMSGFEEEGGDPDMTTLAGENCVYSG